jgi:hypothetical protein
MFSDQALTKKKKKNVKFYKSIKGLTLFIVSNPTIKDYLGMDVLIIINLHGCFLTKLSKT